ncbi:hypothetical protein GW17_00038532 [Ensete ventricosum]|nr:hypothetical protein GW17_00038532 [Ensete ventricosum]
MKKMRATSSQAMKQTRMRTSMKMVIRVTAAAILVRMVRHPREKDHPRMIQMMMTMTMTMTMTRGHRSDSGGIILLSC